MHCLIVDDSRTVRRLLRSMLYELGFDCEEAEDGESAIVACRKSMPSLILLDWNMPGISGIECLSLIRKMDGGTSPKIILCTTNNDPEQIAQALESGADEYIMKPFDADILQYKLEDIGLSLL